MTPQGSLAVQTTAAVQHPDVIASLLVQAGAPPTQLLVEEEDLEDYFLRLVGMSNGGTRHE